MSYFVGNIISSVYENPEYNTPEDIEYYIGAFTAVYVIPEMLLTAIHILKDSSSFSENAKPVKIIGTNDIDLMLLTKAYLQYLGADYAIEEDYTFVNDFEYVFDENNDVSKSEISASVKYMFMLTSVNTKTYSEPVIGRVGGAIEPLCDKKAFDAFKAENCLGSRIPSVCFDNPPNPENNYYSNTFDNEEFDFTLAMKASELVLEVIGLTFTDNFYYEMKHLYDEKAREVPDVVKSETPKAPKASNVTTTNISQNDVGHVAEDNPMRKKAIALSLVVIAILLIIVF